MEFSRPEYWSGLLLPSPGDLPNLRIEPRSPALQADSLPAEPPGKPKLPGVLIKNTDYLAPIFRVSDFSRYLVGAEVCIPSKYSDGADAAGLGHTLRTTHSGCYMCLL